jgi:hypothetical protein
MESHLAVLSAGEGTSGAHRTLAEKAFETLAQTANRLAEAMGGEPLFEVGA